MGRRVVYTLNHVDIGKDLLSLGIQAESATAPPFFIHRLTFKKVANNCTPPFQLAVLNKYTELNS